MSDLTHWKKLPLWQREAVLQKLYDELAHHQLVSTTHIAGVDIDFDNPASDRESETMREVVMRAAAMGNAYRAAIDALILTVDEVETPEDEAR